jgi:hypothetical protein
MGAATLPTESHCQRLHDCLAQGFVCALPQGNDQLHGEQSDLLYRWSSLAIGKTGWSVSVISAETSALLA